MRSLPVRPHPVWLKSFWLVISLGSGLLVGVFLSLLVSPPWLALGVAIALVSALPGLLRPETVSIFYRKWNTLTHWFTRVARAWIALVYFLVVFTVVGRVGSTLKLVRPIGISSMWVPLETDAENENSRFRGVTVEHSPDSGWVSAFLPWAARPGNWWCFSLLPFLVLLSALESEREQSTVPTSIYTLY